MKKRLKVLNFIFLLSISGGAFSQKDYGAEPETCKENLTLFYEYAQVSNFEYAFEPWQWCYTNCPESNLNIYSIGIKMAEDRYQKAMDKNTASTLIDDIYAKRIKYFPKNLGKVYSDWAISLESRGANKEQVFEKLEAGYKADPSGLSIKNLAKYFQEITLRYKDTDVEKVFNTYDDVMEDVNNKIDSLTHELDGLNALEAKGEQLTQGQKATQNNHGINLRALGQVEDLLDNIISGDISTCETLIDLYNKNFESHKTDAKWLKRAASKLNSKDCNKDAIFPKIVEAFVTVQPSPEAYLAYANILEERGQTTKAIEFRNKAINAEQDPYKKAKYLYLIANSYRKSQPATAVSYAKKAIQLQPSMGRAYLLIASLYASNANQCGSDEFSKRMVFVAAAEKAAMAKKVDPSVLSLADKHLDNYRANIPTKLQVHTAGLKSGEPFKINCWIGETVRIP